MYSVPATASTYPALAFPRLRRCAFGPLASAALAAAAMMQSCQPACMPSTARPRAPPPPPTSAPIIINGQGNGHGRGLSAWGAYGSP